MKRFVGFMVFVLCLCIVPVVCAQDASSSEEGESDVVVLEEVVVTASRAERKLSKVSSSISVISEEEIKDSNAKNIPDLLKNLEGIYTYDSSGVGTAGRINMRGFWGGMSTHQLILIDGIPQNKGKDKLVDWDLIPLDNIERIEVLRGPASALYGDNAMSGVINIITKRPGAIPETKISGSCGSFNTRNYNVSTSGMVEKTGYYLGVSGKSTDGFRRHSDYENIHLNGKLDFLIDEAQNLKLSLNYHEKERGPHPWAITEAQIEQDRRQAKPGSEDDKSEVKKSDSEITYHKDIGNFSDIEGTFYYRYEDGESFFYSTKDSTTYEQLENEDTCGLLFRLNTNSEILGRKHFFTTGIDLEKNDVDYRAYAAPDQVRGAIEEDYRVKKDKIGPYIQDEIQLLDPLVLIAGIRYDLVEFDFADYEDENNSKKKEMSKITPRCGIVYTYQEDSNIYANYAQAFRTPTIGQLFTYGVFSNPDLNPEEATNYEMGIRHRFNDYLKASVSLYCMRLDNEIWYDGAAGAFKNYGETSHKGIETSLDFKLVEGLTGFVNYTYTRAKNESGDYEDKYLTNIPIHKGGLGARFETDFGLKANLIITRVGSSYLDKTNDNKLSGYTTVDTKINYEHEWWSLFLAVDNLLDEEYNSYGYIDKYCPAPGRTFTLGLSYTF